MSAAFPGVEPVVLPYQNLLLLPILHGRLECAGLVRQAFELHQPDAVAVELPSTLKRKFQFKNDRNVGYLIDIKS